MAHPFIQCLNCLFYKSDFKCEAFPVKIPTEIIISDFDHTTRHPDQDNDIVFEPITKAGVDE